MTSEDSLIDEAKQTLDELVAEGFSLRQVKFEPKKGCRICQIEEPLHLTIIFAGKKIEKAKVFLYCMAKVCTPCLAIGEAEHVLSDLMQQAAAF